MELVLDHNLWHTVGKGPPYDTMQRQSNLFVHGWANQCAATCMHAWCPPARVVLAGHSRPARYSALQPAANPFGGAKSAVVVHSPGLPLAAMHTAMHEAAKTSWQVGMQAAATCLPRESNGRGSFLLSAGPLAKSSKVSLPLLRRHCATRRASQQLAPTEIGSVKMSANTGSRQSASPGTQPEGQERSSTWGAQ